MLLSDEILLDSQMIAYFAAFCAPSGDQPTVSIVLLMTARFGNAGTEEGGTLRWLRSSICSFFRLLRKSLLHRLLIKPIV